MLTNHCKLHLSNAKGVAGFSLVELMVSITIGLFLLLGLATLLLNSTSTHTEMQKSSAQIENGRYATQLLSEDIRLAGYYGEYSPPQTATYTVPADTCATTVANLGWTSAASPTLPVAIYGFGGAASDPTCVTNRLAGTAILVVRRVKTFSVSSATAGPYLQVSMCNSDSTASPFVFNTSGFTLRKNDCTTSSPLHGYLVHIYYISSCNVCGTDTTPTLKMVEFADGVLSNPIALVEGIEDMQFDYGIDASNDGSPDSYVAAPATAADWANVMAVRINLLARNIASTKGYDDSKTYALGLAKPTYTVPTGVARTYKRHAYSTLVRVENPSARRESP